MAQYIINQDFSHYMPSRVQGLSREYFIFNLMPDAEGTQRECHCRHYVHGQSCHINFLFRRGEKHKWLFVIEYTLTTVNGICAVDHAKCQIWHPGILKVKLRVHIVTGDLTLHSVFINGDIKISPVFHIMVKIQSTLKRLTCTFHHRQ